MHVGGRLSDGWKTFASDDDTVLAGWKIEADEFNSQYSILRTSSDVAWIFALRIQFWQNQDFFQFDLDFFLSVHFLWKRFLHLTQAKV